MDDLLVSNLILIADLRRADAKHKSRLNNEKGKKDLFHILFKRLPCEILILG
jgi:hypothetical protein